MLQQKVCSGGAQSIRLRHGARVCIGARRRPPADCQLRCVVGYLPHTCWRLLRHGRLTTMLSRRRGKAENVHRPAHGAAAISGAEPLRQGEDGQSPV